MTSRAEKKRLVCEPASRWLMMLPRFEPNAQSVAQQRRHWIRHHFREPAGADLLVHERQVAPPARLSEQTLSRSIAASALVALPNARSRTHLRSALHQEVRLEGGRAA